MTYLENEDEVEDVEEDEDGAPRSFENFVKN